LRFVLNITPPKATHQGSLAVLRRRGGGHFLGKKSNSRGAATVKLLSFEVMPFKPPAPLLGPLRLRVFWVYPWGAKHGKKVRARGEVPCATRPDCDNLSKVLCDVLGKQGFYKDDGQISELIFCKRYGDRPRIEVELEQLRL